jgi:hypothetical protein
MLGLALWASVASAQNVPSPTGQTPAPSIDQRIQMQLVRIRAGVESGQITPAERVRLLAGEVVIRAYVRDLRQSNQPLTPAQRQTVMQALNRMSAAIDRAIHR